MDFFTTVFVSVGLAMDALAVSLCIGTTAGEKKHKFALLAGLTFGGFQAFMPLVGWWIGDMFLSAMKDYDHWVAFAILAYVGVKMIIDSFSKKKCAAMMDISKFSVMLALGLATSMDALAVGLSFSFLQIPILLAVSLIGGITFLIAFLGVLLGKELCRIIGNKAGIAGGIILILIGVKILAEHLNG